MQPDRLGKFLIRRLLGQGGMGRVYEGWDPSIGRRVALKTLLLPDDGPGGEAAEALERFRHGVAAAGRLQHPNIVAVHDFVEGGDAPFIVMEFVDGQTLRQVLAAEPRPPLRRVLAIMADILGALGYSHRHGVVHRDLKPDNVLMGRDSRARLADFGIARIESSTITQTGTVMGTPAYMSPEQVRGLPADGRSDLYSAGVILYQMLAGTRPFEGGVSTVLHRIMTETPPPPSTLAPTAPAGLDGVVARAMAHRAEDRFATARDFLAALEAGLLAEKAAGRAADATVVMPREPPAPVHRRGRTMAWLGAAGAATLLAGTVAAVVIRPLSPPALTAAAPAQARPSAPPGWMRTVQGNCEVWLDDPRTEDQVSWSGACRDGKGDGPGTWTRRTRAEEGWVAYAYAGALKEGRFDGPGRLTMEAVGIAHTYEGGFLSGLREGNGVQTALTPSGYTVTYTGGFHRDLRHGAGQETDSDGVEKGSTWLKGLLHGTVVVRDGARVYAGQMAGGRRTGVGTLTLNPGSAEQVFEGTFVNDALREGSWTDKATGRRYEGGFDPQSPPQSALLWPLGKGTMTYPNGSVLTATWVQNGPGPAQADGEGTLVLDGMELPITLQRGCYDFQGQRYPVGFPPGRGC